MLAGCVWLSACSSEPKSPLVLGRSPSDTTLGPRTLSPSQSRALRNVIAAAGENCGRIDRAYLRDVDAVSESWDVGCADEAYSVLVREDSALNRVIRCASRNLDDVPCLQPYAGRSYGGRRAPRDGPLNPDLGKLLEPMTAKDGKSD